MNIRRSGLDPHAPVPDDPATAALTASRAAAVVDVRDMALRQMGSVAPNTPFGDFCLDVYNRLRGL